MPNSPTCGCASPTRLKVALMLGVILGLASRLRAQELKTDSNCTATTLGISLKAGEDFKRSINNLTFRVQGSKNTLSCQGWGFSLDNISLDVDVWHGERDRMVPVCHAQDLCSKLCRSHYRELSGEGHFSLVIDHAAEILSALKFAATETAHATDGEIRRD